MNMSCKKILSSILVALILYTYAGPAVRAAELKKSRKNTVLKTGIQKNVKRKVEPKKEFTMPVIEDELVNDLNVGNTEKIVYKQRLLEDETDSIKCSSKNKKHKYKNEIVQDEPILMSNENKKYKRSDYKKQVKTENGAIVVLKPVNKIKTRNGYLIVHNKNKDDKIKMSYPYIGDKVAFKVVNDVIKDGKVIIPKETIVYAKIGAVSPRAMGGAPAEMRIEDFEMYKPDGTRVSLDGEIESSGYSLSFWIGVAELATTPFLIGFAVPVLRLLPGGQAVVSPRKNYVVYY